MLYQLSYDPLRVPNVPHPTECSVAPIVTAAGGQRGESVRGPGPGVEQKVSARAPRSEDRPGRDGYSDSCSRLDPMPFRV
ncbi:protein of unknown function [Streptomyces murinus]